MANHSHECETADVGSFCDCDCAGSRHAVKRTVGGVPGAGGVSKAARAAAEKAGVTPVVNNRARPADGHRVAPGAPKSFKAAHAEDTAKQEAGRKAVEQRSKDMAAGRKRVEGDFRKAAADTEKWSREKLATIKADNPGMTTAQAIAAGRKDPEFKKRLAAHHEALAQARRDGLSAQDIDRIVGEERKKADKADPVMRDFDKRAADLDKRQADLDAAKTGKSAGKAGEAGEAAGPAITAKQLTPQQGAVLDLIAQRYERKDDGSTAGMDPAAVDQLIKAGVIRRSAGDGPTVHMQQQGYRVLAEHRGDTKLAAVLDEMDAAEAAYRKAAAAVKDHPDRGDLKQAERDAGGRMVNAQNARARHMRETAQAAARRPAAKTGAAKAPAGKPSLAGGGAKAPALTDAQRAGQERLASEFATDRNSSKATSEALLNAEVSADTFASFPPNVQAGVRKRMQGLADGQSVDPAVKARAAAALKRWDGDAGEAAASQARRADAPAPMAKLAQEHVAGTGGYLTSFNKMTEYGKTSFDALNDRDKKSVVDALEKEIGRGGDPGRRAADRLKQWTGRDAEVKPDPMPEHARQAHRALEGQSTTLPRSMVYGQLNDNTLRTHFTAQERAKMRADGAKILAGMREDARDRPGLAAAMTRIDAIDGPPGKPADDGAAVKVTSTRRGRSTPRSETVTPDTTATPDAGESLRSHDNLSLKEVRIAAREAELRSKLPGLSFAEKDAARQRMHELEKRAFQLENPWRTPGPSASTFKGKKVPEVPESRRDALDAIAGDPRAKLTWGQQSGLAKSGLATSSGTGTMHLTDKGHIALAAMRGDGNHQRMNEKVADADAAAAQAASAAAAHAATRTPLDRDFDRRQRDKARDAYEAQGRANAARFERSQYLKRDPLAGDTPAGGGGAGRPTSVDDVKPGFTYTDKAGNTVTVVEAPGKIKGFRVTSSDRGDRPLLMTPAQLAADAGLSRDTPAPAGNAAGDAVAAKEAEVKRLSEAHAAHWQSQAGSGSMRTKRFGQQVDAHLKRSVALGEQLKKAEAELAALKNPKPQSATAKPAGSFTPQDLDGKKFIKTVYGWFEVVKVNRTSVRVKGGQGPGNPESILIKKIIDAR